MAEQMPKRRKNSSFAGINFRGRQKNQEIAKVYTFKVPLKYQTSFENFLKPEEVFEHPDLSFGEFKHRYFHCNSCCLCTELFKT